MNLRGPDDLTDQVRDWLAESYALVEDLDGPADSGDGDGRSADARRR